jgi:hypothetical protein
MNTGEHIYQSLVDTIVKLSVTWIDRLDAEITESHVLEYTKGQLSRHFEALSAGEFLRLERYLNDHGLLHSDANSDAFMAVYNSLWNTIEIELSKLYA